MFVWDIDSDSRRFSILKMELLERFRVSSCCRWLMFSILLIRFWWRNLQKVHEEEKSMVTILYRATHYTGIETLQISQALQLQLMVETLNLHESVAL